jgi:coenzyme F420-reducing hydrogenase alpha subunit
MKENIINIFKHKNATGIVSVLLVASVIANAYLLAQPAVTPTVVPPVASTTSTSTAVIESPYGVRSEVVTVYENGKAKTYSTTTPITEKDLEQMRKQTEARFKAMDDYFREQEKFFRSFWYNF